MTTLALCLIVAAGVAQMIGFGLLIARARRARQILNHPDAFNIDGGDVNGHVEGPHIVTTIAFLYEEPVSTWWALAAIGFGIVAGTAGSVIALWA